MFLLFFYLGLALGFSFLCSILEAALLSITPVFIKAKEQEGATYAAELKKLKENVDRPLSAILSLNTIAHTIGAAGVGAQAGIVFGDAYFAYISAALTILILIFSEIIPKSLGAKYWKSLAPFVSKTLKILVVLMYPLVFISEKITNLLGGGGHIAAPGREDIAAMAELGTEAGVFDKSEFNIINNLIKFKKIKVEDVMTPRTVVLAANSLMTIKEFFDKKSFLKFSRIPVYKDTIDHVTGFVLKNDVMEKLAYNEYDLPLAQIQRMVSIVHEEDAIPEVFELLLTKKEHIALVVDQYGGMAGIVTLEDIIETLLGLEIQDELDSTKDMQQLARKKWEERAKQLGLYPKENEE
ncbi:CNNM domain-containing protein [Marinigracilibium pacificum]|uniref:HlyC/CorC family transporter n=1 Tax=Marinigracilibium pacificum TaxID=2729599 RepID=A0A848IZJ2_9BACT|nr:hemolysin family protein [Marinigracilibium pacificum]NMM49036.1 HlyC/CorC family transporter [Marinigracilibium pacificum]